MQLLSWSLTRQQFLVVLGRIQPLWRNWLARSAVNRKVGGSSPPRGVQFLTNNWLVFYYFFLIFLKFYFIFTIFTWFFDKDFCAFRFIWSLYLIQFIFVILYIWSFTRLTNLFSDSNWLNWMVFDISSPTYSPMFIQRQFYPICFKLGYFVSSNSR